MATLRRRLPLALLALALAVALAASARLRRPAPGTPPRTGAEAVDRFCPLLRALAGELLWIQLLQDMPCENDAGAAALADQAAHFELLVEYLPYMTEAYAFGAEMLARWGGRPEALRLLERGVTVTGDPWLQVRLNAEQLARRQNDYPGTIAALRRAVRRPEHPLFLERLLARCYREAGDTATARRVLQDLLARCPDGSLDRSLTRRALDQLSFAP